MKKYLNKGLLYEWFNAAKIPILIGVVTWGVIAHSILEDSIGSIKNLIGSGESNNFNTVNLEEYFILGIIFLAIYIFASGNNKRNTTMFLCSGPYTKRQIKFNELICLLMTLGLFVIVYVYILFTIYVRYDEFIAIVNGFFPVAFVEIARLLLLGTVGILLMIGIDLLFNNSIIAYFGMMSIGMATIFIWHKFRVIASYFGSYGSLMDKIFGNIVYGNGYIDQYSRRLNILFFRGAYYSDDISVIVKGIIFLIIIIGIMLFMFSILEKLAKLESTNKIFSSKVSESIIVIYLSLGVGAFINMFFLSILFRNWRYMAIRTQHYLTSDSFIMLSIDVITLGIITFISYKIFKKILKVVG